MQQNTIRVIKQVDYRYLATSDGKIFSLLGSRGIRKKPKELSQHTDKKGYKKVTVFFDNGKRYGTRVHRLVASAFLDLDLFDKNLTIHHKDGDKSNNNVSNLEVISSKKHFSTHAKDNRKEDKHSFTREEKEKLTRIKQNQVDDFFKALGVIVEE
jgi:hypothetical protein